MATLHIFADASKVSYGAVAYLCLASEEELVTSSLLLCRSRFAPFVGRLELMACQIATRIMCLIKQSFHMKIRDQYLWTDSMIALHWIIGEASRWKQFVRNSVSEIQENTKQRSWRHCTGGENPANLVTRD